MQNQKKTLWLTALAGALTIAFASGCPDDDKSTSPSGTPTPTPSASQVTYYEWHKLDAAKRGFTDAQLNQMLLSDGNFYFATAGEGLVIWDGKAEDTANFTKLKGPSLDTVLPGGGAKALSGVVGADNVSKLTEIGKKKVVFVVGTTGIGVVNDKAMEAGWIAAGANGLSAHGVNALYVAENAAGAKFLYGALANDGASNIVFQPLAGLIDNWNNALQDSAPANLDKQGHAFGLDKDGNLMIAMATTAGVQGIKQVAKANIGGGTNRLTGLLAAHGYTSGFADAGEWANAVPALHIATFGDRLVLATNNKLLTIDNITVAAAANRAKKIKDVETYGFEKDGADGLRVFTKTGVLYVKKDGTLDADKEFDKASLKTGVDLEAGKTSDYKFTNDIKGMVTVGEKTYFATGDQGVVVREAKKRNK